MFLRTALLACLLAASSFADEGPGEIKFFGIPGNPGGSSGGASGSGTDELSRLRVENAALREQVARLQREVARLQGRLDGLDGGSATPVSASPVTGGPLPPAPATQPDAPAPSALPRPAAGDAPPTAPTGPARPTEPAGPGRADFASLAALVKALPGAFWDEQLADAERAALVAARLLGRRVTVSGVARTVSGDPEAMELRIVEEGLDSPWQDKGLRVTAVLRYDEEHRRGFLTIKPGARVQALGLVRRAAFAPGAKDNWLVLNLLVE